MPDLADFIDLMEELAQDSLPEPGDFDTLDIERDAAFTSED